MLRIKENNNETIRGSARSGGVAQDVTGWSFIFIAVDSNGVTLFQKVSSDPTQIAITDAVNGKVAVYILPADTNNKPGTYQYELQGTDTAGRKYTLDKGTLEVTPTIL